MKYNWHAIIFGGFAILLFSSLALAGSFASSSAPATAGRVVVSFLYMPPSQIEPTYHTAMWIADKDGHLLKTLFVSNELSANEYKQGDACPDWVKQASWAKAEKSLVDAVSGPTPNVGNSTMAFDLGKLGITPGTYQFCFQVHITEKYNILFRGTLTVGSSAQEVKIDTFYTPGKPPGGEELVREVQVQYVPADEK